jgi:hypothetical protein
VDNIREAKANNENYLQSCEYLAGGFLCFANFGLRGVVLSRRFVVFGVRVLLGLEDDQSKRFALSSSLSSLGAKRLLGSAGLRHHALMLDKILIQTAPSQRHG